MPVMRHRQEPGAARERRDFGRRQELRVIVRAFGQQSEDVFRRDHGQRVRPADCG